MVRTICWMPIALTALFSMGCAICCGPDDFNYANYGGVHQRGDMAYGRVGSIFSDSSGTPMNLTPNVESAEYVEPENVEELPKIERGDSELPTPKTNGNGNPEGNEGVDTSIPGRQIKTRQRVRPISRPQPKPRASVPRFGKSFFGGARMR